jgi:hypothetical protein
MVNVMEPAVVQRVDVVINLTEFCSQCKALVVSRTRLVSVKSGNGDLELGV